jgi:hypothetical protein
MNSNKKRFPFSETGYFPGQLPSIPLILGHRGHSVTVSGLLDTGATVNVLPYDIGRELGAVWEQQITHVRLTGNFAQFEARGLNVTATVNDFDPVPLIFAWTRKRDVPVILGQINFFLEFDACFFGAQGVLEISPSKKREA